MSEFYRNILIATDGSKNSLKAISYGIEIAKLSGATVHVMFLINFLNGFFLLLIFL